MKYEIKSLADKLLRRKFNRCIFCGKKLTGEEIKYYSYSCEKYEIKQHNKIVNDK